MIVKRILMMHGFKRYPDHFEIMNELGGMIGMSEKQIVTDILDHLDSTHLIDQIETDCPYVVDLVIDHLINSLEQNKINDKLAQQLYKIHLQLPNPQIFNFLVSNMQNEDSDLHK